MEDADQSPSIDIIRRNIEVDIDRIQAKEERK